MRWPTLTQTVSPFRRNRPAWPASQSTRSPLSFAGDVQLTLNEGSVDYELCGFVRNPGDLPGFDLLLCSNEWAMAHMLWAGTFKNSWTG